MNDLTLTIEDAMSRIAVALNAVDEEGTYRPFRVLHEFDALVKENKDMLSRLEVLSAENAALKHRNRILTNMRLK